MSTEQSAQVRLRLASLAAILSVILLPISGTSHHSFSGKSSEISEIQGELVSVTWRNPHVLWSMKRTNDEEEDELWTLEAGTIYNLERRGIERDLFEPGELVTVAGRLSQREDRRIWVDNMRLGDGREVLIDIGSTPRWSFNAIGWIDSQQPVDANAENRGVFRVWSQSLFGSGGSQKFSYDGESNYHPDWRSMQADFAARCESMGMPAVMMGAPTPIQLVDHGGTVQLLALSNNAQIDRTIHISDHTNLEEQPASRMGFSVGRWEGNTLVVETTRIDWPYFLSGRIHGRNIETIERFVLSDDQRRLGYEMTVDAPFLSEPGLVTEYYIALGEDLVEPSNCPE